MIKAMFKKKHAKDLTIILTIIVIGFICINYPYYRVKRIVVKKIEAQIAEMETKGLDEPSYYFVGTAYVNNIEDKKLMIKIIKKLKPNIIDDLIPTSKTISRPFAQIGDISMSYGDSYWFYPYSGNSFNMRDKDRAAFDEFVSGLEQREPENLD